MAVVFALFASPAFFIAWKAVPVKTATSALYDYMVEQAKWAGDTPAEVLEKRIVSKANELNIPIDPRFVKVARPAGKIHISASFTVPIEFPGYTYNWDFDLDVERPVPIK